MPKYRAVELALALPVLLFAGVSLWAAEGPKPKKECLNTREINVMSPLDDKHVFVKARSNDNYLFTMDPCPGLSLARKLVVWESATRLCEDSTSMLAFEDLTIGQMRCRIAKIDKVKDKDAAIELADAEVPPKT